MSANDRFQEEEERRRQIIRKSLATRSSYSGSSGVSTTTEQVEQIDQELREMERQESVRLKDDWKRWEARVRHERSTSGEQHPAASKINGVPILAIPTPAKHRAQGRLSSIQPLANSPPPPSPPSDQNTPS